MYKKLLILGIVVVLIIMIRSDQKTNVVKPTSTPRPLWQFRSIDTMKYSRDLAREKLRDEKFADVIDSQIKQIAETGATHIAIATPYDDEFIPILTKWVQAARKYNLKVWFRGNWSGWEGWFSYPRINRSEHIAKTKQFIESNPQLFVDGDAFSSCPECENGGPGDPRNNQDVQAYRQFLIDEYKTTKQAFQSINKKVDSNFFSMNGDVARLVMDPTTTAALDGIVTIDHYVKTPEQLSSDIKQIAQMSGGKIVLGEFGAPIPDIHGKMTPEEQAIWLQKALQLLDTQEVIGLNYWTHIGSSTALWHYNGDANPAVSVLSNYYEMVR